MDSFQTLRLSFRIFPSINSENPPQSSNRIFGSGTASGDGVDQGPAKESNALTGTEKDSFKKDSLLPKGASKPMKSSGR